MPPTPSKIPGYTELDPSTGLHVTGQMQSIDVGRYRLELTGKVARPLALSYDEIRCLPRMTARPALVCTGFFTDTASWAGVPLKYLLELAGVKPGATAIRIVGADGYTAPLPMNVAMDAGSFLAYEWEGKALPRLHGFPLRAVFPGEEGNKWVKWITRVEVY
jgi:DMSO/TMAO reductase YedYZ molybdopterin-dependent catalytic subunit